MDFTTGRNINILSKKYICKAAKNKNIYVRTRHYAVAVLNGKTGEKNKQEKKYLKEKKIHMTEFVNNIGPVFGSMITFLHLFMQGVNGFL